MALADCCEIVSGATPSTTVEEYWGGEVCWATPKDLSDLDGHYISDTPRKLTKGGLSSCAASILPPGSVLFSSRAPIGHVAINTVPMATNQGFKSFVPNTDKLEAKFLFYWLRANRSYLEGLGVGATFKEVSKAIVSKIKVPVPPLPEQRRIAAILDQADALRAKRREALAQLDSLTQSIFIEMFGGAQTIHEKWPVKPLGEMLEFLTSGSRGWAEYYAETGAFFLRIQNVCRDELDLTDVAYVSAPDSAEARRTEVREGDVLLSITADLGRTAVVPPNIGKAHINQHLSILRTKAVVPRYLSAFLASLAGQREVMGRNKQGVKAGLNFDDIRSFRIPIPPSNLQQEFVARAEKVKQQCKHHHQSLNELDSLFSSLQHRAFRGEL
jgi:type I restriction enzyme S subunit